MDNAADDYKFIADRMKDLGYRAYTGLTPPDPDKPKVRPKVRPRPPFPGPTGATGAKGHNYDEQWDEGS